MKAQNEWANWSSVQFNYVANDKLTFKFRPITRVKENFGSYNNSSLDASLSYKLGKQWTANILHRHFFIPDKLDVEFLFFDIKHSSKLGNKFAISNLLRYHLNFNWTDNRIDFLRYMTNLKLQTNTKTTPFGAIELWLRTNDPINISGARYMLGAIHKLKPNLALNLHYRRQSGYSDFPIFSEHVIVINLIFTFKHTPPN